MAKRWLSFLAVWLCCLVFFYAYRQWASVLLFGGITTLVEKTLDRLSGLPANSLEDIFNADLQARTVVAELLPSVR